MKYYLYIITLTNMLFLLLNAKYLIFLRRDYVVPSEAARICYRKGKRKIAVRGRIIGVAEVRKGNIVSDRLVTLNNSLILNTNERTVRVLNEFNRLTYGEEVKVYGTVEYIGNDYVLHNIEVISVIKKKLVSKYLNKQYTKSAVLAILIVLLSEAVKYGKV